MSSIFRTFQLSARLLFQLVLFTIGLSFLLLVGLNQLHSELLKSKVASTKSIVELAYSVLESQHQRSQKGIVSEEEAKETALDIISKLRYDDTNYFWINDMAATMVMHPIKPALNGKNLSDFEDPNGKRLFTEFVDIVKAQGQGQVDYMWPAPDGDAPVDKVSYVKGFTPWGYIVGSDVYIQDVDDTFWSAASTKLFFGLIIIAGIAMVSIFISRSVTQPIKEIVNALSGIAAGDGDLTQRLPKTGGDEVATFAETFNAFIAKVHNGLVG